MPGPHSFSALFQEEQQHFLQGSVLRLSLPPFVALAAGSVVGVGVVPNWGIVMVLVLAALYAFDRFRLAQALRGAVRPEASREQVRAWRRRLAGHLAMQGVLWAIASAVIVPGLSVAQALLFLCVMITVLGIVCTLLPAPVMGLRFMCAIAYLGGIGSAMLVAQDLQRGLVLCGILGLCSQELILERNVKAIRSRLRAFSRRERLRRRLLEHTESLVALNHSKSVLLATASHDLRQPVHALALLTERLGEDQDPAVGLERVLTIRSTSEYLLELLNKLMDYSRIELGKQSVSPANVEVGQLVSHAVRAMQEVAQQKQLQLVLVCDGPWMVRTDPALLRRVLHNLLDNALKYTHRGGVTCRVEQHSGKVEISVTDTGPGIPQAVLGMADGPHIRPPGALGGGMGLGLGVVRGLCRLLDCDFQATSAPGGGTCVRLVLDHQPHLCVPAAQPGLPQFEFADGVHVMLVEDNPVILKAMVALLKELHLQVHPFDSGERAASSATDVQFGLVISDLHLGTPFSGLDVIRSVRARPSHGAVPALLLSGDIGFSLPQEPDLQNVQILHKPASPQGVRRAIGRALDIHAARQTSGESRHRQGLRSTSS